MPRKYKRRKTHESQTEDLVSYAAPTSDSNLYDSWPGWCELDSEPAFFNVMLREIGVKNIKLQEVFGLDEACLAQLPSRVHALIFLFRYEGNQITQTETECPEHIWFANQVPDHACASVALLNIVNNIPDINLGPQMTSFRELTGKMSPYSRGEAVDSFDHLRKVHNSFSRELDMRAIDLILRDKYNKHMKREADERRKELRDHTQGNRSGFRRSARIAGSFTTRDSEDDCQIMGENQLDVSEDSAFHFIAYMPIRGEIWQLDGLDNFPICLGSPNSMDKWLRDITPIIQQKIALSENQSIDFSLMAVVDDEYDQTVAKDATNGDPLDRKSSVEPDSHDSEQHNQDIITATLRRHDYKSFFTAWMAALKENDVLDTLNAHVKADQ